ncbi:MAG: carboxymuconolactone decarboxylase family protein [Streptosporangiaceae bacterium]
MSREHGVSERQLADLSQYRESDAFSADERLVLDLAVEMAKTPTDVPEDLLARLRERFTETQLVELAATVAWENYRARFNRVFGVGPVGFSSGGFCAVPEHKQATARQEGGASPEGTSN